LLRRARPWRVLFARLIKGKLKINANAQLDYQETIIQSGVAFEVAKWGDASSYTALDVMGSLAIGARTSTSRSKLQGLSRLMSKPISGASGSTSSAR
jgi:hypothetical protein